MNILNLIPVTGFKWTDEMTQYITKNLPQGVAVATVAIEHGPASIEDEYDDVLAAPEVVMLCKKAEDAGYDAVLVSCFGEPGVRAARECTKIPVFGGFEPGILYAMGMADKIAVITVIQEVIPLIQGLIARDGFEKRVTSVRCVGIPVLDLSDHKKLVAALVAESKKAIEEDGVGVIVLGCTGMVEVAEDVEKQLALEFKKENKNCHVPIIEAAQAAMMMLDTFIRMKWRHSEITYMPLPDKARNWWDGKKICKRIDKVHTAGIPAKDSIE
jgi:allantoin racemase